MLKLHNDAVSFELLKFSDPESLAEAAASDWLKELQAVEHREKPFCIALSGGRIARTFLSAAFKLFKNRYGVPRFAHFFWGDERCVPPQDPESNFKLANDTFLLPLQVPPIQVHRILGEAPPQQAVTSAEADLRRWASESKDGQPVIDMVFLGMGEDGHIASLFPAEPEQMVEDQAVFRSVIAVKPPPNRITLGYAVLASARQVWVLASGVGKETALRESLSPGGRTPLARLLKLRSQTRIFTDLPLEKS